MRFWLVEVPALIVSFLMRAYAIFLTALALAMFLLVIYSLAAVPLGWPVPF
jgi:hypothetical protein